MWTKSRRTMCLIRSYPSNVCYSYTHCNKSLRNLFLSEIKWVNAESTSHRSISLPEFKYQLNISAILCYHWQHWPAHCAPTLVIRDCAKGTLNPPTSVEFARRDLTWSLTAWSQLLISPQLRWRLAVFVFISPPLPFSNLQVDHWPNADYRLFKPWKWNVLVK